MTKAAVANATLETAVKAEADELPANGACVSAVALSLEESVEGEAVLSRDVPEDDDVSVELPDESDVKSELESEVRAELAESVKMSDVSAVPLSQ
jgi:hypothetical protein